MCAGRDNISFVDKYRLPIPEVTSAGNRVVHIGERNALEGSSDEICVAVRQYKLTTALKRDAILNELQGGRAASGVEGNNSRIVDNATERQQGAVADRHAGR